MPALVEDMIFELLTLFLDIRKGLIYNPNCSNDYVDDKSGLENPSLFTKTLVSGFVEVL